MPPPKAHRGHGEGSIQERNGKFRASIMIDGKRHSHTTTTRTAARAWLRNTRAAADKGELPPDAGALTVAEHLDRWLEITAPTLKPKTLDHYRRLVRLYLKPSLGEHKLAGLRPDHVQDLTTLLLKSLAPRTVTGVLGLLHHALDDAIKWGLLARNVTSATTRPRIRRLELTTWTPSEARTFLASLATDRREALYRLALSTGMRQGELLGLRWEDLDLSGARLHVRRNVQRIAKLGIVVGEPKSGRGRTIALTTAAIESLRAWKTRQETERIWAGTAWTEAGYIFTTRNGTPPSAGHVGQDFAAKSAAAGLPRIRFHDLRHTCATILLSQGVHPKVVQEMLGHSQISMTMDTYSHVLPHMQNDAARLLGEVLGASGGPSAPVLHPTTDNGSEALGQ